MSQNNSYTNYFINQFEAKLEKDGASEAEVSAFRLGYMAAISNVDVLIEKYPSPKELTTICSELSKAFNEPSPKTKCFKTHGEEIVKDLGYKFDRNYQHDQFNTNRYRKDILLVEFTYKGTELLTIDLIIGETDSRSITYEELKAITPVICKDSK